MRALFIFVAIALLFGCSGSESSSHRRGKLSDAVKAASNENTGSRSVDAAFQPSVENQNHPDILDPTAANESPVPSTASDSIISPSYQYQPLLRSERQYLDSIQSAEQRPEQQTDTESDPSVSFGINAAERFLSSNDFTGMTTLGLNVSMGLEENVVAEFGAEMSFAPLKRTGKLSHSVDDGVLIFGLNFQILFPSTPRYTVIGQYFFLGAGTNTMLWTYKNPITAPVYTSGGAVSGHETITSDMMNGIDLFTGIGFDLSQTFPVHLIVEVRPGVIIWTGTTAEGFENDIFANTAYLQFRLKLSLSGL
jgi:hypothetical protein